MLIIEVKKKLKLSEYFFRRIALNLSIATKKLVFIPRI